MPLRLARPAALTAAALAYAAALVALPSGLVPALADTSPGTGPRAVDSAYYRSSVLGVEPATPGLTVTVTDGGTVTLENRTGVEVVVLGYDREPYLQFTSNGMVLRNSASLTTALVEGRAPGPARPPGSAPVRWDHLAHVPRFTWADARTRWSSAQRPEVVQQDEHAAHRVLDWTLDVTVDGRPALVRGAVDWTGTPRPPRDDLLTWAVIGAVLAVTVSGLGVALRRRLRPRAAAGAPPAPELVRTLHATPPPPRRTPYDSGDLPGALHLTDDPYPGARYAEAVPAPATPPGAAQRGRRRL